MSAYRFVTLTCDGCGEIWDHGCINNKVEARRMAKRHGWLSRGNDDRCPTCVELGRTNR